MGHQKINLFIYIILLLFVSNAATGQTTDTTFSFTLANNCQTSAGVYKADGTLVRTLWSAVNFDAGEYLEKWDGLLDDGTPAPIDKYQVKVLTGNVTYEWEGAMIGNTSTERTGSTKLRFFDPLCGMAVAGKNIYWAAGYNEGWPSNYKTSLNNPNSKTWIGPMKQTNQASNFVCTDGNYVYWAGFDPIDTGYESFIFATKVSDDSRVAFRNGVTAGMEWGSVYQSVISYKKTSRSVPSLITGVAVQNSGDYMFVSRQGQNELLVINKTTGEIIHTLNISSPSVMQVDQNNNLWLAHGAVVEKYIVADNGTLNSTQIVISLSKAGAISVSPDNATVIIADIDAGQVKAFNNKTGVHLWNLGTTENYITNATVKNDKFYWKDIKGDYGTFLCYLADGTFYIGDQQNRRVQHYSSTNTFIDRVMYLPSTYNVMTDINDPTRLFADFLEFKIDYSRPLAANNDSWVLDKNWGGNISNDYDLFSKMKCIATLKNGRTYAILRIKNDHEVCELVQGGAARFTNILLPKAGLICKDGNVINSTVPVINESQSVNRYTLNGFDIHNNPVWSVDPEVMANTPPITANDPVRWAGFRAEPLTSSNQIIFFDNDKSESGRPEAFHLGAIDRSTNKWLWKTAKGTANNYSGPFPLDGAFDNGNGVVYPGGTALISERHIFWGYHGEFWKQSQTNKWNHVYDNGLLVGQFGELTTDHPNVEAFAAGAGNVLTGSVVTVDGQTYLYHNDESVHGGVHRWKINGLNEVKIQTAQYPATKKMKDKEGVDLLKGLVRGRSLQNDSLGWTRFPIKDYENEGQNFSATTGEKTYNKFGSPDLFIRYGQNSGSAIVTRDLGDNYGLSSWKLWGKVLFDYNTPNEAHGRGGSYLEILDKNNFIIATFYIGADLMSGTNIVGNNQVIYNSSGIDLQATLNKHQPIEISCNAGILTFKYANFNKISTTVLTDNAALWQIPAKLRIYFFTNAVADNFPRSIDISEMRFSATTDPWVVLPVTSITLSANKIKDAIKVAWKTIDDNNIKNYVIEKSIDGQIFTAAGSLQAIPNGAHTNNYSWMDVHPNIGNNYYRILYTDKKGKEGYSSIVSEPFNHTQARIDVYPNPFSGNNLMLRFDGILKGSYSTKLINSNGRLIFRKSVYHSGGTSSQFIAMDKELVPGVYNLQIKGNGTFFNKQIIKL